MADKIIAHGIDGEYLSTLDGNDKDETFETILGVKDLYIRKQLLLYFDSLLYHRNLSKTDQREVSAAYSCPTSTFALILLLLLYLVLNPKFIIISSSHKRIVKFSNTSKSVDPITLHTTPQNNFKNDLPICVEDDHAVGSWIYKSSNSDFMSKSFYCCPYYPLENYSFLFQSNAIAPFCGASSVPPNGHKVFQGGYKDQGLLDVYMHMQEGCKCDAAEGMLAVHERERYKWVPSTCELVEWNSSDFCQILGYRTIIMIGDSTMMQVCRTIVNMLVHDNQRCTVQIKCGRQDQLVGHKNDNYEFIELIDTHQPEDFVIFSTGAHYTSYSLDDFNTSINDVFNKIDNYRHALEIKNNNSGTDSFKTPIPKFIWMQPTPGHINCQLEKAPWSNLSNFNTQDKDIYKWRSMDTFNNFIVENLLTKYNVSYLDTSLLKYRPDGHFRGTAYHEEDCLHFCAPGPLNELGRLVLHKLKYEYEPERKTNRSIEYDFSFPVGTNIWGIDFNSPSNILLRNGVAVGASNRGPFYLIQHGKLCWIPNMDTFYFLGLSMDSAHLVVTSYDFIDKSPKGPDIPACTNCRRRRRTRTRV